MCADVCGVRVNTVSRSLEQPRGSDGWGGPSPRTLDSEVVHSPLMRVHV